MGVAVIVVVAVVCVAAIPVVIQFESVEINQRNICNVRLTYLQCNRASNFVFFSAFSDL